MVVSNRKATKKWWVAGRDRELSGGLGQAHEVDAPPSGFENGLESRRCAVLCCCEGSQGRKGRSAGEESTDRGAVGGWLAGFAPKTHKPSPARLGGVAIARQGGHMALLRLEDTSLRNTSKPAKPSCPTGERMQRSPTRRHTSEYLHTTMYPPTV